MHILQPVPYIIDTVFYFLTRHLITSSTIVISHSVLVAYLRSETLLNGCLFQSPMGSTNHHDITPMTHGLIVSLFLR